MSAPAIQLPLGTAPSARRSSAAGHWFRAILIAIGLIVASIWTVAGVFRMNDRINAFTRVSIPGEATMRIDRTGGRVVYYEGIEAPIPREVDLRVTDPSGRAITVGSYGADLRYDVPGATHMGQAIATFDATVTGAYRISVRGVPQPDGQVAVGQSVAGIGSPTVFGATAILLVLAGGLALVIVTAVRRSRYRRPGALIPPLPAATGR